MLKKLLVIFSMSLVAILLLECSSEDEIQFSCNCPDDLEDYFRIQGIENELAYIRDGNHVVYSDTINSIELEKLVGFKINLVSEFYSLNSSRAYSIFPTAVAISPCVCPENGELGAIEDTLEEIFVVTLNDFSPNLKSGDTINDIILVESKFSNSGVPLNEFVEKRRTDLFYRREHLFELTTSPDKGPLKLKFEFHFKNEKRFISISDSINVI